MDTFGPRRRGTSPSRRGTKRWAAWLLAGALAGGAAAGGRAFADPIALVEEGRPVATLVLATNAARAAQLAAFELRYHVEKITGAVLPIVSPAEAGAGARILVGESPATLALGFRGADFQPQEYAIAFRPQTVVILGRDKEDRGRVNYAGGEGFPDLFDAQGTLYAAYDFLERFCDVRWYLPTDLGITFTPCKTLTVAGADVRRSPHMKYRYVCPNYRIPEDLCGDTVRGDKPAPVLATRDTMLWHHRNRMGGVHHAATHSFYGYYDRFLKEHPEWFAQGYEKAMTKPPQLCYTHPEVIAQVVRDARDYFDGKGLAPGGQAGGDGFAVVPMDNGQWCRCPRCAAALTHGSSAYVFGFVNAVAAEIKKTHPDKHLNALAYMWFYTPPPFPVESNVHVELCIENRRVWTPDKHFETWAGSGRPLTLWMYYCFPALSAVQGNYRVFPPFFAHEIVKQNRSFREAGVVGMKYEPSYLAYERQSPLLDQVEFHVTWRLADDPELDGDRLIAEFFTRYYGAAAEPMKAFYEEAERVFLDPGNYPKGVSGAEVQWGYLGTEARMAGFAKLMEQARALARTDVEKRRVALFDKGIWQYMLKGREAYLPATRIPLQSARVPRIAPPASTNLATLDWSKAVVLANWRGIEGNDRLDKHDRQMEGRLLHDGTNLYVRLQDMMNPAQLVDRVGLWDSDEYELFFGKQRGPDYTQIGVSGAGRCEAYEWPAMTKWEHGAKIVSDRTQPDRWLLFLVFPLDKLVPGGVKPGEKLFMNIIRSMQLNDAVAWNPTFAGYHAPRRMGEIVLE